MKIRRNHALILHLHVIMEDQMSQQHLELVCTEETSRAVMAPSQTVSVRVNQVGGVGHHQA